MAKWLKQSTAVTVVIGPFVDDTDFKSAETALTLTQADVRLSKNAGAFAQKNDATSCTHMENGHYSCPLNATDTGTLGILRLVVAEAGALQVWDEYLVVPAHVYDGLVADTDKLQVDTVQVGGTAQTAGDIIGDTNDIQARLPTALVGGRIDASVGAMAAGVVTAAAVATGAVDADALAADAVAEIADGVWDEDIVAAHGTADTAGRALRTLDAVSDRTNNANLDALLGVPDSVGADVPGQTTDEVWDELKSAHATPNTFGDYLDIEVSSRLAPTVAGRTLDVTASGDAEADLQRWRGDVPAFLDAGAGRVFAISTLSQYTVWDSIAAFGGELIADSSTTTSITDAQLTEATTDYWKGAVIVFKGGTLNGVARLVTAFDPATNTLTFAPATPVAPGASQPYYLIPTGAVDVGLWRFAQPNVLLSGRVDANMQALANAVLTASAFAVDAIDASALSAAACAEIADKLLGRSIQGGADGGRTVTDALRYLRNRVAISGGTMTVYQENDASSAWTAAVTTAAGNPITEIDPA